MNGLDVYEILVREHQDMLLAYVSGIVDDHALVEDVCQEAFIDGFRNLAALRRDESFPAWLRTIARHRALLLCGNAIARRCSAPRPSPAWRRSSPPSNKHRVLASAIA